MYQSKLRALSLVKHFLIYSLLVSALILTLLPLLWSIAASFTPNDLIYKYAMPFSLRALWPVNFTLENYRVVLFPKKALEPVGEAYVLTGLVNSLMLSVIRVIGGTVVASMAAFAIAKMRFIGRRFFFIFLLLPLMMPVQAIIIPGYILASTLNLLNTYWVLILPGLADAMVIFLLTQFFAEFPQELIDAARMDGASWFQILTKLIMPISKPALITAGLLLFLSQWNDFFWPLLVASSSHLRLITVAIAFLNYGRTFYWSRVFAGSMLAAIVPILLFLPLQRYYIAGLVKGSLKG